VGGTRASVNAGMSVGVMECFVGCVSGQRMSWRVFDVSREQRKKIKEANDYDLFLRVPCGSPTPLVSPLISYLPSTCTPTRNPLTST